MKSHFLISGATALLLGYSVFAETSTTDESLSKSIDAVESKVITWRRDIHQHPELGNREFRTAKLVAEHLKSLGIEVKTNVAKTGVVGLLKGDKPGPVVALRADMDALPVTERVDLPFASKVKTTYNGQEVGVMHACGHDTHVAILMGVAEVLSARKSELAGTVKFIFQPAEEGAPAGEEGGAELMVKEGVLENPKVDAIFALHISSNIKVGKVHYRPGGIMASMSDFRILVKGKQTHGAYPWEGTDPIVAAAQIINNLQTVVSRNLDVTENAGVVTIGSIHGGNRFNIIPEQVEMIGTIRALSEDDVTMINRRVKEIATKTAEATGATAEVKIPLENYTPVTYNDPKLTEAILPSLRKAAGDSNVEVKPAVTGAEDFAFFQQKVPGFYFFLGGMPKGMKKEDAPPAHTPDFKIDESGLKLGVRVFCELTLGYMNQQGNSNKEPSGG